MSGIAAAVALVALFLVPAVLHAARRRRRDFGQRPMVLATPGGRAFAAHVDSLSDFRMDLRLPPRR